MQLFDDYDDSCLVELVELWESDPGQYPHLHLLHYKSFIARWQAFGLDMYRLYSLCWLLGYLGQPCRISKAWRRLPRLPGLWLLGQFCRISKAWRRASGFWKVLKAHIYLLCLLLVLVHTAHIASWW